MYELTDWGRELEHIVISLGHWAARSPSGLRHDAPVRSADSVILALRGRFDARAARGLHAEHELRIDDDRFRIAVADDRLDVAPGDAQRADATIDTDADTIAAVLWGARSLATALRSGTMTIEGDQAVVERLVRLFPAPAQTAAPSAA